MLTNFVKLSTGNHKLTYIYRWERNILFVFVDFKILNVSARDADSPTSDAGKVDYSINTGALGKFVINSSSGEIKTAPDATFDYDVQDKYIIQVH